MSEKIKLTPKDCLYLDDALSQLCTIATRISSECENITNKEVSSIMEETIQVLSTHFEDCKNVLKEASES